MHESKAKSKSRILKGWAEIAAFLGQTASVVQRWHETGMPVTGRAGVFTPRPKNSKWVGTEQGKSEPVHIASAGEDLVADLKQGLSYVRDQKKRRA
jgi:hypothetical protein